MMAGYIGMMIATTANWKVTYLCSTGDLVKANPEPTKDGKPAEKQNIMDRQGIDKGFNTA